MKATRFKRVTVMLLAAMIVSPTALFADNKKDEKKPATDSQQPAQASTEPGVGAPRERSRMMRIR